MAGVMLNGQCLCGAVKLRAVLKDSMGACHCSMCQKWCGGPLMSAHAVGTPEIEGADAVSAFSSSPWAERGFCGKCGSHLWYRVLPSEQFPEGEYLVSPGLFDALDGLVFDHEVFVDEQPAFYSFAGETARQRMTGAEVFALFAGGDDASGDKP